VGVKNDLVVFVDWMIWWRMEYRDGAYQGGLRVLEKTFSLPRLRCLHVRYCTPTPRPVLKTGARRPWTRLSTSHWHARGGGAQGARRQPLDDGSRRNRHGATSSRTPSPRGGLPRITRTTRNGFLANLLHRRYHAGSTADSVRHSSPSSRAVALCRKMFLHISPVV
jgi:hypothetical protein